MIEEEIRLLLVEESARDAALILNALAKEGYLVHAKRVQTEKALRLALARGPWDLVVSDYALPGFPGPAALQVVRQEAPDLPFILVSTAIAEEAAIDIMRAGARDYVMKDRLSRLAPAIRRELAEVRQRQRRRETEKMLLARLNQAQKMEAIGTLAGGVAHDCKNILYVVKSYAELALTQIKPGKPGYQELQGILQAIQRSAELTNQLLAFARKQKVTPKVVNLNDTVAGMLKMLRRLIGDDIDFKWLPAENLWPVMIDAGQVDQILANLCVNSRDAIIGQGRLSIATANVTLDKNYCAVHADCVPGDYVQLSVSDNGMGMDRETQDHIFEPFFTTKGADTGTGLGLAMIYGIVKQNQGMINFYSEPGQGTIFRIYLPRQHNAAPAAAAPVPGPSSFIGGAETILLVEDDKVILDMTARILKQLGYRVLAAATPSTALQQAKRHPGKIDLLLSDVVMPELNGCELAQQITRLRPGIRCLFMSGYTADFITDHELSQATVHFLAKPFSLSALAEKVRLVLDHQ